MIPTAPSLNERVEDVSGIVVAGVIATAIHPLEGTLRMLVKKVAKDFPEPLILPK